MMPSKTPRLFHFSVLPYLTCWLFILMLFPHECRVDSEAPGFREKKEKRGHQRTIPLTLTPLKGRKLSHKSQEVFHLLLIGHNCLPGYYYLQGRWESKNLGKRGRGQWLPTFHCLPYTGRLMLLKVPTAGKCGFWISNWVSFPKLVPSSLHLGSLFFYFKTRLSDT